MIKIAIALFVFALALPGQNALKFEVDPTWPKPLPEHWITGQVGGVCTDSHDHIVIVNRRNITKEEAETEISAPSIIMFDNTGKVIASIGDPDKVPNSIHGCAFDRENNFWVGGNDDGILQKYSHDGKLLLQIGTRGLILTRQGSRFSGRRIISRQAVIRPRMDAPQERHAACVIRRPVEGVEGCFSSNSPMSRNQNEPERRTFAVDVELLAPIGRTSRQLDSSAVMIPLERRFHTYSPGRGG